MSSNNIVDFSIHRKKSSNKEEPIDDLVDHAHEISEDLMNDLLSSMINDYDFNEDFYVDTPELLFAFEALKSFIFAIYDLPHPLQELSHQVIYIDSNGNPPIPQNDNQGD